jgi:hypothetical protein
MPLLPHCHYCHMPLHATCHIAMTSYIAVTCLYTLVTLPLRHMQRHIATLPHCHMPHATYKLLTLPDMPHVTHCQMLHVTCHMRHTLHAGDVTRHDATRIYYVNMLYMLPLRRHTCYMPHDPPHRHIATCHMPHATLKLHATCYMLTCHMLHAITLHATCHYATLPHATLHAACHISCHMLHATCHMLTLPHAITATCYMPLRHMPYVTCHMPCMPHAGYMLSHAADATCYIHATCHVKMLPHATRWRCHVNTPHASHAVITP